LGLSSSSTCLNDLKLMADRCLRCMAGGDFCYATKVIICKMLAQSFQIFQNPLLLRGLKSLLTRFNNGKE